MKSIQNLNSKQLAFFYSVIIGLIFILLPVLINCIVNFINEKNQEKQIQNNSMLSWVEIEEVEHGN